MSRPPAVALFVAKGAWQYVCGLHAPTLWQLGEGCEFVVARGSTWTKKHKLQPCVVVCHRLVQMLLEEFADLYGALNKANYPAGGASEKPAAYDAFFAADGAAHKHLANFAKVCRSLAKHCQLRGCVIPAVIVGSARAARVSVLTT